jgi:hypothetical protein
MSEFGGLASSSKLTGGDTDVTNQITLAAHLVTIKLCTRATYDIPPPVYTLLEKLFSVCAEIHSIRATRSACVIFCQQVENTY